MEILSMRKKLFANKNEKTEEHSAETCPTCQKMCLIFEKKYLIFGEMYLGFEAMSDILREMCPFFLG